MKKIIEFVKQYTLKDFIVDLKFFGSILLVIFGSWLGYIIIYSIMKGVA